MLYKVYRSLDKTNSLFGIKGSYQKYALIGIVAAILLGFVLGMMTNGLIGTLVALGGGAAVYVAILSVQSRFSERERTKWFCSHRLPDCITVPPRPLRRYLRFRSVKKNADQKTAQAGRNQP